MIDLIKQYSPGDVLTPTAVRKHFNRYQVSFHFDKAVKDGYLNVEKSEKKKVYRINEHNL